MFIATKEQIKNWVKDKIYADFKPIDNDNANVYGLRFKTLTKEEATAWLSTNLSGEGFKVSVKNKRVIAEHYEIDDTRVSDVGYTYGVEHVIKKKNGIAIRILVEPSEEYKDVLAGRDAEEKKKQAEIEAAVAQEKLIQEKMRELAIAELEKEGKI